MKQNTNDARTSGRLPDGKLTYQLLLTPLEPQSRCGDKLLEIWVVCTQNGTAVLKGLIVKSVASEKYIFFRSIAPFSLHVRESSSLWQHPRHQWFRRVSLCAHDYRAFRMVQAALQRAAAVVSSHELVIGVNGGISTLYSWEDNIYQYARPC